MKKRKFNNILVILLISLLVTAMLFGCSNKTGDTGTNNGNSTDTTSSANTNTTGTDATDDSTITDLSTDTTYSAADNYSGSATSFTNRSDDFSVGYYISDGKVVASQSVLSDEDGEVSRLELNLESSGPGVTPVIATGSDTNLSITGNIEITDTSDGSRVSDFTGLGTQIVASDYAEVNIENLNISTTGFLRDALIADSHAQITVSDSTITTMGADPLTQAYSGYVNSANQSIMISPPWVLGIQGGVRLANVLGDNATISVMDSTLTSGSWAVLSTDACSNPVINVLDSSMTILTESEGGMSSGNYSYSGDYGSGYGTYLIGNAEENFYGASISGTTYVAILCGGTATYQSSNGEIDLYNADGELIGTYTGQNKATTIDSVFGFMSHNNGTINVLDSTQVSTQDAVFLYKAGNVTFNADDATLTSGTDVILQMMDNDDSTVGISNGSGGPVFNTTFSEDEGWPSETGNVTTSGGSGNTVELNLTNGTYEGNIYNGTGYYGQTGDTLNVTLGDGALLNGAIALTETIHVDENGDQNTSFTINEYYYLGHVANRVYNNGNSRIAVTLTDGAVWTVTGTSSLTSLTISDGTIQAADGKTLTMTVDGVETDIVSGQTYTGDIVLTVN